MNVLGVDCVFFIIIQIVMQPLYLIYYSDMKYIYYLFVLIYYIHDVYASNTRYFNI